MPTAIAPESLGSFSGLPKEFKDRLEDLSREAMNHHFGVETNYWRCEFEGPERKGRDMVVVIYRAPAGTVYRCGNLSALKNAFRHLDNEDAYSVYWLNQ